MLKAISDLLRSKGLTNKSQIPFSSEIVFMDFDFACWSEPSKNTEHAPGGFYISTMIEYMFRRNINARSHPLAWDENAEMWMTCNDFYSENPGQRDMSIWQFLPCDDLDEKTLVKSLIEDVSNPPNERAMLFTLNFSGGSIQVPLRVYHVDRQ